MCGGGGGEEEENKEAEEEKQMFIWLLVDCKKVFIFTFYINIFWCTLLIHVVSMIIVRSV